MIDLLLISSPGGHYVQMKFLKEIYESYKYEIVIAGDNKYGVNDCNSRTPLAVMLAFTKLLLLIFKKRPKLVISTGAAPGALAIIAGKTLGCKTIWIDSVANFKHVSKSCNLIKYISDHTFTQWKHLSTNSVKYIGGII